MSKEYLEALEEIRDFRYGKDKLLVCQTEMYKTIKQALQRLESIDNANPSEASIDTATEILLNELEMISDCAEAMKEAPSSNWIEYAKTEAELDLKLHFAYLDLKQALIKSQEQEKVLSIIKEKCLYTDNLNEVATCLNYNYYKERMSKKYDTKVVKTDWNDKALLDYLKLLTEEEFDLLKRWTNERM